MCSPEIKKKIDDCHMNRGEKYIPYYKAFKHGYGFLDHGSKTVFPSKKCGRCIHCNSDLEFKWAVIFEHDPRVIDYREQFPVAYPEITDKIAEKKHYTIPKAPEEKEGDHVLTTDFCLTVMTEDKGIRDMMFTCKQKSALNDKRTRQLLDIEKTYWEMEGYAWDVLTQEGLDEELVEEYLEMDADESAA